MAISKGSLLQFPQPSSGNLQKKPRLGFLEEDVVSILILLVDLKKTYCKKLDGLSLIQVFSELSLSTNLE